MPLFFIYVVGAQYKRAAFKKHHLAFIFHNSADPRRLAAIHVN